jgi:hypothetical protein
MERSNAASNRIRLGNAVYLNYALIVETRWDENAGLQAGCDKLPLDNALEGAIQKETGYDEEYHRGRATD